MSESDIASMTGTLTDAPSELRDEKSDLEIAKEVLLGLLENNGGCVSTRVLVKALEKRGVEDTSSVIALLKFPSEDGESVPEFHHLGRSFFTPDAYRAEEERRARSADQSVGETPTEGEPNEARQYRQEETRLCSYVQSALDDIYGTQFGPDTEYSFDVHNDRPGSVYENVDLLCVHWRSQEVVEIVAVEAKLEFNAIAVQQAMNYSRFSDRVWIAVPISSEIAEAGQELRANDPLLFDYVVENGIGILACKRRQGRAYQVSPIHWPKKMNPDLLSRHQALERYRYKLEIAEVIPPKDRQSFPSIGS